MPLRILKNFKESTIVQKIYLKLRNTASSARVKLIDLFSFAHPDITLKSHMISIPLDDTRMSPLSDTNAFDIKYNAV